MAKKTIELDLKEQALIRSLREQPELRERFESIVALTQTDEGKLLSADDVEELLIQEVRALGQTTMEQWAKGAEKRVAQDFKEAVPKALARKKKR